MPPGPVAAPLSDSVRRPGATASNSTAPEQARAGRAGRSPPIATIVMSTRPGAACCVNVAFAPPERMKLPS